MDNFFYAVFVTLGITIGHCFVDLYKEYRARKFREYGKKLWEETHVESCGDKETRSEIKELISEIKNEEK